MDYVVVVEKMMAKELGTDPSEVKAAENLPVVEQAEQVEEGDGHIGA